MYLSHYMDPGGNTTSVTVQRQDQTRRPPSKRRICKCFQQIPPIQKLLVVQY